MSKRKKKAKQGRSKTLPLILAGAGLILIAVFGLLTLSNQGQAAGEDELTFPPITADQPAPELTLRDLDGNEVSLSDYQGKVVLLNNWATWCPPCKEEMPVFNEYYNQYRDQGFEVLAVEAGDPEPEVRAFAEQEGLDFTILLDPDGKSLITFQNQSLPNSFVIDRKGHLRLAWTGAINRATLETYVTPLLKE